MVQTTRAANAHWDPPNTVNFTDRPEEQCASQASSCFPEIEGALPPHGGNQQLGETTGKNQRQI